SKGSSGRSTAVNWAFVMLDRLPSSLDRTKNYATRASIARPRSVLPFFLVETLAICSDAALIIATSVVTGTAYYLVAFKSFGPLSVFFGVGLLSFINFSAVLGWRTAYRPHNLADFWKQARETAVVWLFVF